MMKLLDLKTCFMSTIKVRFIRNTGYLDVTNNSSESPTFSKDEALDVEDLRSIGYYKIKQTIIHHHL